MKETIKVIETVDYHGCELCGLETEYSTMIHYGAWSYGECAVAHCFGSRSTEYSEAFDALIKYLELPSIPVTEARPYASKMEYILFFKSLGYNVTIEAAEEDEEIYQEALRNCYDDDDEFAYNNHDDDDDDDDN